MVGSIRLLGLLNILTKISIISGLFHHAIAQSGTANAMWATHADDISLRYNVATFARAHNCYETNEEERLQCLRTIPYEKFRASQVYTVSSFYIMINVIHGYDL